MNIPVSSILKLFFLAMIPFANDVFSSKYCQMYVFIRSVIHVIRHVMAVYTIQFKIFYWINHLFLFWYFSSVALLSKLQRSTSSVNSLSVTGIYFECVFGKHTKTMLFHFSDISTLCPLQKGAPSFSLFIILFVQRTYHGQFTVIPIWP